MRKVTIPKRMNRFGIGPFFALVSVIFAGFIFLLNFSLFPQLVFHKIALVFLGIFLIIIGIMVFVSAGVQLHSNFHKGGLEKKGMYQIVRHPIYGAWIVCIMPGIVLIAGGVLGVIIPFFMYAVFRIFIVKEENYLEKKFGTAYRRYQKNVGMVFPKF
jgi:protein-S-isoprenylcysteine O-methyltransferase Ste14